jgi:hypothetical protein
MMLWELMLLLACGALPQDFLLSALLAAEKTLGYRVVNLIEGSDRMTVLKDPNMGGVDSKPGMVA